MYSGSHPVSKDKDSLDANNDKLMTILAVQGAKWDTYDFVYKIEFCYDKRGFCYECQK
jgi:hypothetical protein